MKQPLVIILPSPREWTLVQTLLAAFVAVDFISGAIALGFVLSGLFRAVV